MQPVEGRAHRRPLGMVLAEALLAVALALDLLTRCQVSQQDVTIHGRRRRGLQCLALLFGQLFPS